MMRPELTFPYILYLSAYPSGSSPALSRRRKNTGVNLTYTPKLTNATIKRAVRDYRNGGARKQRVVTKYGEISNWDVSNVEDMRYMFNSASSFNQPLTMMLSRMIQNEMQSA